MPSFKRKRSSSKRPSKRSKTVVTRPRRSRLTRKYGYRIPSMRFHRWVTALGGMNVTNCTYDTSTSVLVQTNGVQTCQCAIEFKLSDVPNQSEFSNLFDQYIITGVMFQIKLTTNPDANYIPSQSTNGACNFYPTIWYVPDHDDSGTVTLPQIKEFEKVRHKVLYPNRETNIMLRPTTLQQIYNTATTAGYAVNRNREFLDMATPNIPHYGLKFVIDFEGVTMPSTTDQRYNFKINAKYFFKCKGVR